MTERAATKLPTPVDVLDLDVNDPEQLEAVADDLRERWGRVDGILHAIAFAPEDALGGKFLDTPPESAATAFQTSAYSLKALSVAMLPLMEDGGAIVGMDFDGSVAWPVYDWMGVSKAALEAVSRYLARDLGPQGRARQPRLRRPARHARRARHPRLRAARRRVAAPGAARAGTPRTPAPSRAPCCSCCPTSRAPSPARSCTSTAASTRWAPPIEEVREPEEVAA